jgi:hypothetical protein
MRLRDVFVRNMHAANLLEAFLVASVSALLAVRFYLAATGYPQVGGAGLHIAHMLWGGLLMLTAIVLLLAFLGRRVQLFAALVGGAGFGIFIDELGKFITSNNNYFFQPTIALIYIIFILLLLIFRVLERRSYPSGQKRLVNALGILQEGVLHDMNEEDRTEALLLLRTNGGYHPLQHALIEALENMEVEPTPPPGAPGRIAGAIRKLYLRLVQSPRFAAIIIGFFVVYALVFTCFLTFEVENLTQFTTIGTTAGFVQISLLASSILSDILIIIGIVSLRRSPRRAYLWFKRAILVSIFFTQVFMFYTQELGALGELAVNLVVLLAINYMLHRKRHEIERAMLMQAVPEPTR